jgi:lipid II:glycine glycyltransferase (peptidoglycan interpeptide bridge formation enzyme)
MIVRQLRDEEKPRHNQVINHPLQTWEWGEFRKKTGTTVTRIGFFEQGKIHKSLQITFHKLPKPFDSRTVGYLPKGEMPDEEQLHALAEIGKEYKALFIKLEPNVSQKVGEPSAHNQIKKFLEENNAIPGRPLFTKYSIQLDLTPTEEELFENLENKTRYNVRLASKKGVEIFENTTEEGMEQYIKILSETTKRQGFYAHSPEYYRTMWQELGQSGMIRIFNAVYEDKIIVSWVMFIFKGVIYYPYGASSSEHRNVMASNLMMWEMIKLGKREGCHLFDMWGSLGPDPDTSDPWYGFHKFKLGYGGDLVEFAGSYDLILDDPLYKIFRIGESLRWKWLRLRSKLPF